ncbi:MAG: sensor histidine kinase [Sphingopyxis sp.]
MLASGTTAEAGLPASFNLVEEINHRVVNEYSEAIAMLSIAAARMSSGDARAALRDTADRLRDHAETHRALMAPMVMGRTNIADHITKICRSYVKSTLADRGVRLTLKIEDGIMPAEKCWRIGLVVAELVRNAARHGLKGKDGRIVVDISHRAGHVTGIVSDSGPGGGGAPGRGQRLVRSLITDLGGEIRWFFEPGGTFAFFRLPSGDGAPRACRP